ncbi:uncharacterized protein LOC121732771 [Aricia agestis]|uniref:uncharacterized protein LOC121732771 n=1 Tax=Aricia agestis TaxID=91739 RepID=UPI001C207013|nr:uncharacterized protein LOC121732771 [Aricia agestis]
MSNSQISSRRLGFSVSNAPFIGGLIDYITKSYQYVKSKSFVQGEILHQKKSQVSLSPFLIITAFLLGVVTNVKFEVGTIITDEPLSNDLHNILLSKEDNLYTDDIDVSKVMLCLEASDAIAIIISSSLVWLSSYARPQLRNHLFLPWLGVVLRGVLCRQAPTAAALLYTMVVINNNLDLLFLSTFCALLIVEARVWLEVARIVVMKREKRVEETVVHVTVRREVPSVEIGNFHY